MQKVTIKMDSKVLDNLVRDECIKMLKWCSDNQQDFSSEPPMNIDELNDYYNQIIQDLKSQSKEKVND